MLNQKNFDTKVSTTLTDVLANITKKGTIKGGDNLNNYLGTDATGFYEIQSGVSNTPASWSWLIVVGGAGTLQIVLVQNRIYVRCYTGTPLAWTAWRSVGLS